MKLLEIFYVLLLCLTVPLKAFYPEPLLENKTLKFKLNKIEKIGDNLRGKSKALFDKEDLFLKRMDAKALQDWNEAFQSMSPIVENTKPKFMVLGRGKTYQYLTDTYDKLVVINDDCINAIKSIFGAQDVPTEKLLIEKYRSSTKEAIKTITQIRAELNHKRIVLQNKYNCPPTHLSGSAPTVGDMIKVREGTINDETAYLLLLRVTLILKDILYKVLHDYE